MRTRYPCAVKASRRDPFLPLPALLLAFGGACAVPGGAAPLDLAFLPVAHGEPLSPGRELPANRAGERWSVTRLSYLLAELAFQDVAGAWHPVSCDPAWLSLADRRSRWRIADAPAGEWRALRFSVGLPPALNERDASAWPPGHPLNPNLNGLHWSWQGGYIFLAFEGRFWRGPEDAGKPHGFAFHLAREPYRTTVALPLAFETGAGPGGGPRIEFDVARLLDGVRGISFTKDGSSTHSRDGDPLAAALRENLATAFRVADPAGAADPSVASAPPATEAGKPSPPPAESFPLPPAFPKPRLPEDLRLSPARIDLGRRLFHETKLSRGGALSCASCHLADRALSDPRRFSVGEEGRTGNRNAMPLFNLAWKPSFFWDGRAPRLRDQVVEPIKDHRELDERIENVVGKLRAAGGYAAAFADAFGDGAVTAERLSIALETFLLTLVSHDSKYDRAQRGEAELSELERRGLDLFMAEREPRSGQFGGDCFHCHGGALFTDHLFRNNGLPLDPADPGRAKVTGSSLDEGAFVTPSLRNVALTAPYMHDGRFATLEEVLDHYSEGVARTATLDPNLAKHPDGGLGLTKEEKAALAAFLRALTDDRFARVAFPAGG